MTCTLKAPAIRDGRGRAMKWRTLTKMIRLLEVLSAPDRRVDALLVVTTTPVESTDDGGLIYLRLPYKDEGCADGTYWRVGFSGRSLRTAPALTGSTEAAAEFYRQLFPDARSPLAPVRDHPGGDAISICLAALRAHAMQNAAIMKDGENET